jgi:beta-phosphoglucomutase-like phosphatase (HAD superfamily)
MTADIKLPDACGFCGSLTWCMLCDALPDGFKGLIFDCDGTLVETLAAHVQAFRDVLQLYGLDVSTEWCRSKYGQPNLFVLGTYEREVARLPVPVEFFLKQWVERYSQNLHLLQEISETCEVARAWHGRVPMAVASNGRRANVEATLRSLDLLPLFDSVVSVEEVEHGKPEPDLFLEAARRLGVQPADCVVFEDSVEGLQGARRAGMRTVRVQHVPDAEADFSSGVELRQS